MLNSKKLGIDSEYLDSVGEVNSADYHEVAEQRVVIIGLDGTPFSFLNAEIAAGNLPNIAALTAQGSLVRMETEIPTISSIAWTSFMTGTNPGEHGIYGFTDRKPGTYELYFPNYRHIKAEPFWDGLSRQGKRCCVINVPSTYPARPLNGVLVSGFVAPNLDRATYPREAFEDLRRMGYRIDVDASKGRESLDLLIEDLHCTLEKRRAAMLHFWRQEKWDLFMCVFTGTDRLHHFLWRHYEERDPVYSGEFLRFYRRLDAIIGEFASELPEDTRFYMLSDHGFCTAEKLVFLNRWLEREGYLSFVAAEPRSIMDIDPGKTSAYCMDPGRVYINLKGREPGGTVAPGRERDELVAKLQSSLAELEDPDCGKPMVRRVYQRAELFHGPLLDHAPDLVVDPHRGYDFKGAMSSQLIAPVGHLTGMHTYDDAFFFGPEEQETLASIRNVASRIMSAG